MHPTRIATESQRMEHGMTLESEAGHGNSPAAWTAVIIMLIAFAIGPITHVCLRRFHLPVDDHTDEVMGE